MTEPTHASEGKWFSPQTRAIATFAAKPQSAACHQLSARCPEGIHKIRSFTDGLDSLSDDADISMQNGKLALQLAPNHRRSHACEVLGKNSLVDELPFFVLAFQSEAPASAAPFH